MDNNLIECEEAVKTRMQAEGIPPEDLEKVTGGIKSLDIPGNHDSSCEG